MVHPGTIVQHETVPVCATPDTPAHPPTKGSRLFNYFGYGSNMNGVSLRAKGVVPHESTVAQLPGWRLRFNVAHYFRHEGGVANIEPSDDPSDRVLGLVHRCDDEALTRLDVAEAYPHGYDRVELTLDCAWGPTIAIAYIGMPAFIDDTCLPSRRYLNILLDGAAEAALEESYVDQIRSHPTHHNAPRPPFLPPSDQGVTFTLQELAAHPELTGLAGHVFDMSVGPPHHRFLIESFGGRDMTAFHLRRLDTSDGTETLDLVTEGRLSRHQRDYLDGYLHEYDAKYRYVGIVRY
jgi:gamma-glutamylcyclotransferase (GGCT)/AIG2-like uncharacterized protein YtfP